MRFWYILVFSSLILVNSSAQNFGGGAYGGLLTSQANGDGLSGFSFWGVHFGAYTSVRIGDNSDLKLELAFIQKGVRQVPEEDNGFVQYRMRAGFIEVPVLYRLRWNYLSFEIGPALDINVSQFEETDGVVTDPPPNFNRFHLAGIFGINYHFNENWYLNFRSNASITPARDAPTAPGTGPIVIGGNGIRFIVLSTGLVYEFSN
jgi:hypothetical protein